MFLRFLASAVVLVVAGAGNYYAYRALRRIWSAELSAPLTWRAASGRARKALTFPVPEGVLQEASDLHLNLSDLAGAFESDVLALGDQDLAAWRQYKIQLINRGSSGVFDVRVEWQLPFWTFSSKVKRSQGATDVQATPEQMEMLISAASVNTPRPPRTPRMTVSARELEAGGLIEVSFLVDRTAMDPSISPDTPPEIRHEMRSGGPLDFGRRHFVLATFRRRIGDESVEQKFFWPLIAGESGAFTLGDRTPEIPKLAKVRGVQF